MPSAGALSLGAGLLYTAPLGTAEPVSLSDIPASAWSEIGYTSEGSSLSVEVSSEQVEVAESYDPLFQKTTGRSGTVSFAMAENTVRNLTLAFNGGKVTSITGGFTYEPPEPGEEVRRMLLFVSEDKTERWIFRQCFQGGSVTMDRRKGSEKTTIPVEFAIEKPGSGLRPFRAIYSGARGGAGFAAIPDDTSTVANTVSPTV